MVAFEGFTGNGGGDPDSDDPTAILRSRLDGARKAGLVVGKLTPQHITAWRDKGWWDLFNDRYSCLAFISITSLTVSSLGNSAKVTREVVRNSASALSDVEDTTLDLTSDDIIDPVLRQPPAATPSSTLPTTPAPRKNPAGIVSEPKHTPANNFRSQATSSLGNIGEYMRVKMAAEEVKAKAFEARLEMDQKKLDLEAEKMKAELDKSKVDMAQKVLGMDGASEEVKAAANEFLLGLFK